MGKSKKRIIHSGKNDQFIRLSREEAVKTVVEFLKAGNKEVYGLITLFGLTAEEVLEAGADYETVAGIRSIFK
ncbi:MAG: hypothetical protein LBK53_09660 [Heliobacteriaceae bacterium]|jgi:hypothetical protein|nr:hypothetical protein [Heliobacteriaceae bacterium]